MEAKNLPELFWKRVAEHPERVMHRTKRYGQWLDLTWKKVGGNVRGIALGLLDLGLAPGESVSLLSQSRTEWVQCDLAIMSAGGVTIPVYPSLLPEQIQYILANSESRYVIVEDKQQLQKVLKVKAELPGLRTIVLVDPSGCRLSETVQSLEQLQDRTKGRDDEPMRARVAALGRGDVATIVYTSGTTGDPKGVVQTHGNHLAAVDAIATLAEGMFHADDQDLLFLPLAHSFARMEELLLLRLGHTTSFAERIDAVVENLGEVRPTIVFSVPRIYEKIYAKILAGVEQGGGLKKRIFEWALGVGNEVSRRQQRGEPIPAVLAWKHRLATQLVFSKLQAKLGGRLRFFISGGAPLAKEIAEFFHAAGVLILEGYGLTETCPVLTCNRPDANRFGTVGQALPGVELKIAADGEILGRGPNVAQGYFKRPAETAEVFLADGWFATGDIGEIDRDGFLKITDRKKDLIVTAAGKNIAPQNIENLLKQDVLVSQAMAYGDRRNYVTALVTLDAEQMVPWAKAQGISAATPEQLAADPRVVARVQQAVDATNARLASFEQIKYFRIVPQDFSVESGELTPTLKLKRKVVSQRYQAELDAMYSGRA